MSIKYDLYLLILRQNVMDIFVHLPYNFSFEVYDSFYFFF